MLILRLVLILVTILFILLQRVDVRVTRSERLTVKISFTFLALVLSEERPKRRHVGGVTKLLKNVKGVFKSLKYLLSKTDIVFQNQNKDYSTDEKQPLIDVTFHFSLLQLIISLSILLYYIVKNKVKRVI